jgi:response regulator RpfG family c-di-GMP phosphodiesterase
MAEDERKAKILVVDDNRVDLGIALGLLRKNPSYELFMAMSTEEGIKCAHEVKPDLIISNYHLPDKDGSEFCQYVKSNDELSSTMFLLLSGEQSALVKVSTLSHGADDYVEKDVPGDVFLGKVKALLRIKRLHTQLEEGQKQLAETNRLLERNFKELTAILVKILDSRIPGAGERAEVARGIAEYIAEGLKLSFEDTRSVTFAAICHEIGKVGLSDQLIKEIPEMSGPSCATAYFQYPVIGSMIISAITGFEEAMESVYHQLENYDGSGCPDGLRHDEIPIGARILRAITFQEELLAKGLSIDEVVSEVRAAMNRMLDPSVAGLLANLLMEKGKSMPLDIRKVTVDQLAPDMVLADDVYSLSGVKLLPKGVRLQEHMIEILAHRSRKDSIVGGVHVYRK